MQDDQVSESMPTIVRDDQLDVQITTARAHPRNVQKAIRGALTLATLTPEIAEECTYALPRKQKDDKGNSITVYIEGASARFAELLAYSWGNCRVGSRIVGTDATHVEAEGMFHDLETNVAVSFRVKRPITTKKGGRFSSDMITVTGNAAGSIALRNAVLKGIPKPLWADVWERSRQAAIGDARTLQTRISNMLAHFQRLGASREQVLDLISVDSPTKVTEEHLRSLKSIAQAIKDGETTVDAAFAREPENKGANEAKPDLGVAGSVSEPTDAAPFDENAADDKAIRVHLQQWFRSKRCERTEAIAVVTKALDLDINPEAKPIRSLDDLDRSALIELVRQKRSGVLDAILAKVRAVPSDAKPSAS